MKQFNRILSAALAVLMAGMLFAGCGSPDPVQTTAPAESTAASDATTVPTEIPTQAPSETTQPALVETETIPAETEAPEASTEAEGNAILYIGNVTAGFSEYPVTLEQPITAESLIAAISDLTGWNLTLASGVFSGKGGMTVSFSRESALISGPPAVQKDEFLVYDVNSLVVQILDSVQQTLRHHFVLQPGDPSKLDIYFNIEDGDIDVPGTGIVYSQYEPWDSTRYRS